MNYGAVYVVDYLGDLERCGDLKMTAHGSLDEALREVSRHFGYETRNVDGDAYVVTPDPEDDRIIILECSPGEPVRLVWHFSGWHWDHDAGDWPGGPLPQGALPGSSASLYDLATADL